MRVLVTGGLGYLGGRISQYLATKEDCKILIGTARNQNLPDWSSSYELANINWSNKVSLENICSGVDIIIHTSGMNAEESSRDPLAALQVNTINTSNLLNAAVLKGVKKIIYFSTAHVYASPLSGDISEDYKVENLHPYATSHKAAEDVILYANYIKNIEGIVLRLSNSIGAPADPNVNCWMLLVNDLCKQIVQNGKMIIRSNGLQERNFITISDVCLCISKLIYYKTPENITPLYNLGGKTSMSILDMAKKIQSQSLLTLGIDPLIELITTSTTINCKPLNYYSDKLKVLGFIPTDDYNLEIDALLQFCSSHFNSKISV